ncbi:hypothetical protein [Bradyrhizobium sp.]|uniref:hypothetical protein n=1 Tax=Bradyrhizobium sp. TaxID=376 RepID=UPI002C7E2593|nr:hypothetical protein [Bradyrhizobium sp.]HMM92810.1 hypothetical protein [Bradyrhizobium sp.]
MRRIVLVGAAMIASLAMTLSASARLGIAPMTTQDDTVIQVRHGHGHGHHGHGHRGRGHHYGWYRGRGHHKWRHHRRHHHRW